MSIMRVESACARPDVCELSISGHVIFTGECAYLCVCMCVSKVRMTNCVRAHVCGKVYIYDQPYHAR